MVDSNYTHISVLLDASGSMNSHRGDTIGGFNSFLEEQKLLPGKATMTVATFNSQCSVIESMTPLSDVKPLNEGTYRPIGSTSLLDALGETITSLGSQLSALPEEHRPGKVLFIIITDGQENTSKEFTNAMIKKMISTQEEVYKWNFIYLGANVDAFAEAGAFGVRSSNTLGYTSNSKGFGQTYATVASTVGAVRSLGAAGASYELFNSAKVEDLDLATIASNVVKSSTSSNT